MKTFKRDYVRVNPPTPQQRLNRSFSGWRTTTCSETAKLDRFWLEFSAVIPWLGGAVSDEGFAVFGRPEGVYLEARA